MRRYLRLIVEFSKFPKGRIFWKAGSKRQWLPYGAPFVTKPCLLSISYHNPRVIIFSYTYRHQGWHFISTHCFWVFVPKSKNSQPKPPPHLGRYLCVTQKPWPRTKTQFFSGQKVQKPKKPKNPKTQKSRPKQNCILCWIFANGFLLRCIATSCGASYGTIAKVPPMVVQPITASSQPEPATAAVGGRKN